MADIPMGITRVALSAVNQFPLQTKYVPKNLDGSVKDMTGFDSASFSFAIGAGQQVTPTLGTADATGIILTLSKAQITTLRDAMADEKLSTCNWLLECTDGANSGVAAYGTLTIADSPAVVAP